MAKKITAQGAAFDKTRAVIINALKSCKTQEKKLTKAGVQIGRIHFKSDRRNSMYILEPGKGGKRKYIHVGTDLDYQAEKRAEVNRWAQRERLREDIARLESSLEEVDCQMDDLSYSIKSVHDDARILLKKHIK